MGALCVNPPRLPTATEMEFKVLGLLSIRLLSFISLHPHLPLQSTYLCSRKCLVPPPCYSLLPRIPTGQYLLIPQDLLKSHLLHEAFLRAARISIPPSLCPRALPCHHHHPFTVGHRGRSPSPRQWTVNFQVAGAMSSSALCPQSLGQISALNPICGPVSRGLQERTCLSPGILCIRKGLQITHK